MLHLQLATLVDFSLHKAVGSGRQKMKLVNAVLFKGPGIGCAPGNVDMGTCGLSSSQPVQWSGDTNGEMLPVTGIPGCQQLKRDPREMLLGALTHPGTVFLWAASGDSWWIYSSMIYLHSGESHSSTITEKLVDSAIK